MSRRPSQAPGPSTGASDFHGGTAGNARSYPYALACIIVFGALVRLWHIGWGLPDIFEEATPFFIAWKYWNWSGSGFTFDPGFFNYPALSFHLQFLAQGVHYLAGHIAGLFPDLRAYHAACDRDPTSFITTGRCVSVLLDLGTLLVVARLTSRIAGEREALVAGALVACNPLMVQQSQQITVDGPLTFFVVLTLLFVERLRHDRSRLSYVKVGISAGLAMASKYNGLLVVSAAVAAFLLEARSPSDVWRVLLRAKVVSSMLLVVAVFLLLNPYILSSTERFRADFGFEMTHMAKGHFGLVETEHAPAFYLTKVLPDSLGWPLYILSLASLAVLVRQKAWRWVPMVAFLGIYLVVLLSWHMRTERYILPLLPIFIMLGSVGVVRLGDLLGSRIPASGARWGLASRVMNGGAGILLALLIGIQPVQSLLAYHTSQRDGDTRTLAREWIQSSMPSGAVIAMAPVGISLNPPLVVFPIPYVAVGFEYYAPFYDIRWYSDLDLVVGSDYDYARYMREPAKYDAFLRYYYDSLRVSWRLKYEIVPTEYRRGPRIWLYAPPEGNGPERYPDDLLQRLRSIKNRQTLRLFVWNLGQVLDAKGKPAKAQQVREQMVRTYIGQGDAQEALESSTRFLEIYPSDERMNALRDSLRQVVARSGGGVGR